MKVAYPTIFALALLLVAAPAQAGIEDQLDISFAGTDAVPDKVNALNNTLYFGEDGTQIREEADTDDDGSVSDSERDAYVDQVRSGWQTNPPTLEWTMDGYQVGSPTDPRVSSQGLNESNDDSATVAIAVRFNASFSSVSHGNSHRLVVPEFETCRGAGQFSSAFWTVSAIPGHTIDSVNVDTETSSDSSVTVECQENGTALQVGFASTEEVTTGNGDGSTGGGGGDGGDGDQPSTPGFASMAAIAAVAAAWLVVRRRDR